MMSKDRVITFNKHQLARLKEIFPVEATLWTPGATVEELAFAAGAQEVLRVIERRIPKGA